jgi:hypothetical protein
MVCHWFHEILVKPHHLTEGRRICGPNRENIFPRPKGLKSWCKPACK